MNTPNQKIREKIEKLLRLATSPNENEAKSAMDKAVKLMQEHSIEESQLNGNTMITSLIETDYTIIPSWVTSLYDGVSTSAGVYCCYQNGRRGSNIKGKFFLTGREADVQNVAYIIIVLNSQIMSMSKKYAKTINGMYTNNEKQTMAKSYRVGMVRGLTNRMMEMTEKFFKERPKGKDLIVVADHVTKFQEAMDLFKSDNKVKSQSRQQTTDARALIAGESDSLKISINQGVDGSHSAQTKQRAISA